MARDMVFAFHHMHGATREHQAGGGAHRQGGAHEAHHRGLRSRPHHADASRGLQRGAAGQVE
eukprot:4811327-Prymnesium_polylepis.1